VAEQQWEISFGSGFGRRGILIRIAPLIDIIQLVYYNAYEDTHCQGASFLERGVMRTNIVLDDDLVAEAFKYSSVKSKRELVHMALQEFVDKKRRMNLMDLEGQVAFEEGYDYKRMREGL
jgi:Arc/MetJ family transcription regulator|tara:strand:+ start:909 stop:1268 length:360 start_codon:yes stop_codon:yes gene_type:complete